MANKTRFLLLQSIVPYVQAEENGDEIFLKFRNKRIAPVDSKFYKVTGGALDVNVEIPLAKTDKWVELELWEHDRLTPNDSLGHFKLLVDQASDSFTAELIRNKESTAKYVLNWEIIERLNVKVKTPSSAKKKI